MTDTLPAPTWVDVIRELARFADDRDLPQPLAIRPVPESDWLDVDVSEADHPAWFEFFNQGHCAKPAGATVRQTSWGELPSGAVVALHSLSEQVPAVAS